MKYFFLTLVLSLALTGGAYASPAVSQDLKTEATETTIGEQIEIPSDAVPSEEVDYVEESQIAKKMTQAEKAKNAAENDSWGGAITIIAMVIVISALAVLSVLFLIFGKISEALMTKKKRQTTKITSDAPAEHHEADTGEVIAAIAMALSEHYGDGHDMEDTILTIRRMKRAYSPWNSKIYNLRQMPDLHKNAPGRSAF